MNNELNCTLTEKRSLVGRLDGFIHQLELFGFEQGTGAVILRRFAMASRVTVRRVVTLPRRRRTLLRLERTAERLLDRIQSERTHRRSRNSVTVQSKTKINELMTFF